MTLIPTKQLNLLEHFLGNGNYERLHIRHYFYSPNEPYIGFNLHLQNRRFLMKNFDSWLCYDTKYDEAEVAETMIEDRTNELIKTDYNPSKLIAEAVSELTVKENLEMAEYVNENDMTGLGNYIYLKAYDFAHKLATQQAEREFNNGDLNDE